MESKQYRQRKISIPDRLRNAVLKRDGYKCVWCLSEENLHIDHIIPESKGGETVPENLQVLCKSCNLARGRNGLTREQVFKAHNSRLFLRYYNKIEMQYFREKPRPPYEEYMQEHLQWLYYQPDREQKGSFNEQNNMG